MRGKIELVRERMDVHEALRRAVEVSEPDIAAKSQRLAVSLEARDHVLSGDFARLQQAFWNLLKNASKFSPIGGELHLRSRNELGQTVIEFSDTGIGIEPDEIEHIFDAFTQANAAVSRDSESFPPHRPKRSSNNDIATKVRPAWDKISRKGLTTPYSGKAFPAAGSSRRARTACGASRLIHRPLPSPFYRPLTPIEETLSAFTDLVRKGHVRYLGCSNFSAWRLMQSLGASEKHGFESFVSIQPEYSLVAPVRAAF